MITLKEFLKMTNNSFLIAEIYIPVKPEKNKFKIIGTVTLDTIAQNDYRYHYVDHFDVKDSVIKIYLKNIVKHETNE